MSTIDIGGDAEPDLPPGPHPSVAAIAAWHAGLATPDGESSDSGEVPPAVADPAHVRSCPWCAAVAAALDATVADARALPAPTLPTDVRERVDTALSGAAGASITTLTAARSTRSRRATATRRLPSAAGAAAASVAVLLVAAVAIGVGRHGTDGDRSSGGRGGADTAASAESGRAAAPALTGRHQTASGANYTSAGLAAAVPGLVRGATAVQQGVSSGGAGGVRPGAGAGSEPDPALAAVPSTLTPLRDQPGRLAGCLGELTGRPPGYGYAVDFARFEGRPAAVVVVDSVQAGKLDVWVVGPGCRTGAADFRLYKSVDRP